MVRAPERLRPAHPPATFVPRVADTTELVRGDVFDPASLAVALAGVDTAYYLVHSLGTATSDFYKQELTSARNFAEAARDADVRRVICLGGLGRAGDELSPHLASRQDVGHLLCESDVETIEFRASVVLGSGSISFEMIRALVDRLPVLLTPRWVSSLCQPIAVEDVVAYLVVALDVPLRERCTIYEIGGADRVSYGGMMQAYARSQHVRRSQVHPHVQGAGRPPGWHCSHRHRGRPGPADQDRRPLRLRRQRAPRHPGLPTHAHHRGAGEATGGDAVRMDVPRTRRRRLRGARRRSGA